MRSIAIFAAVGGLVAAVALPAYAATTPVGSEAATSLQQLAETDAQSLVVASETTAAPLDRGTYSATTPEEIAKAKAAEAAKARAAAAARSSRGSVASVDLSMVAPGSGAVRYPVASFHYGPRNVFRPASRPNHDGFDMMTGTGSPIFAVADGVVRSSHWGGAFGQVVVIDHVIGGKRVSTLYAHQSQRHVSAGQSVSAGQLIGQVGQTGRASAPHLHFEVRINGSLVNPQSWLAANAG